MRTSRRKGTDINLVSLLYTQSNRHSNKILLGPLVIVIH